MSETFKRVLITGATGVIGGRLCEVMALTGCSVPRALIHSTASASRITRLDLDFMTGDICDRKSAEEAVRGCDAVVHLARGGGSVMTTGLENVLRAAVRWRVSRFVHLSSVAVYGDNPPPESVTEDAPARRTGLSYGNQKLEQERRVLRYWKRYRLPIVILRAPNVYGPFASFPLGLLDRIQNGRMAIVGDGRNPCNLVAVDNLVQSILAALQSPEAVGEVFFVANRDVVSWARCIEDHAALVGAQVPRIGWDELVPLRREHLLRDSLATLPRLVFSSEFRAALRRVPICRRVEERAYASFESWSEDTKQSLRLLVNGPDALPDTTTPHRWSASDPLIAAQARGVAHSSEKARRLLGYTSPVSYEESLDLMAAWLRYAGHVPTTETAAARPAEAWTR
jgi:nucleoside-diphosphate-sugar epimerase